MKKLHSPFSWGVRMEVTESVFCNRERVCVKLTNKLTKRIPSERASQGKQNGANLSFIAPSSEEL